MKNALIALTLLFPTFCFSEEYLCVAQKVYDGDSITRCVTDDGEVKNVRFAGIDAPERRQPNGLRSREDLVNKIEGYVVTVNKLGTDLYGRDIGLVYFQGESMNEYQLKKGNAWYYKKYSSGLENYELLEFVAKDKKIGLWQQENPIAPWDYRSSKK